MEVKYYKEQQHNYMVIRQTEADSDIGYHRSMLKSRNMDHLLRAGVRVVDGQKFNYYDISSRLSLKQLYVSREFLFSDLRELFAAIKAACEEIDRYLLDTRRLDIDPELIFYSCSKEKYSFLYNVSVSPDESGEGIGRFMDFILEKTDPDDAEATDLVYRLYEQYERGGFDVWDLVSTGNAAFNDNSGKESDVSANGSHARFPGEEYDPYAASPVDSGNVSQSVGYNEDDPSINEADCYSSCRGDNAGGGNDPGPGVADYILPAAGVFGLAVCIGVYMFFKLDKDERLILLAAGAVSALVLIAGAVRLVYRMIKGRKKRMTGSFEAGSDDYVLRTPDVHMQDFIPPVEHKPGKKMITGGISSDRDSASGLQEEPESYEGQTVFFGDAPVSGSYKLYALDRKNKRHIELDKLPCTIGKMPGYVDFIIDHPSVSRIHAKIENEGGRLMLSDMNSTNGVYLNGIRLQPNERREIEEGDEIRFGSLNYCLRQAG